jgi:hypothetical protein
VKPNRRFISLLSCLLMACLAIAQGSDNRARLGGARSVALPSFAILDEHAQPVIAGGGKVGFVSSVTGGSLISFSMSSGRVLSTMVVGETVGPLSMAESGGRRLIAVAAANNPAGNHPATVSVIDATNARRLSLHALMVLPADAQITPATRPLLTRDGRFCLIATSFNEPSLLSFDVETGALVSQLPLLGRPSEVAFHDGDSRRIAVASAVANNLALFKLDGQGQLSSTGNFSPAGAGFDESNNPAFSADGRTLYVAAHTGDRLFALSAESAAQESSVPVTAPRRITVVSTADGDVIGITRTAAASGGGRGGATVATNRDGRLAVRSEFTPPEGIEFSRANNVAFDNDASAAFIGSVTGMLFAFNTETGELESYQTVGSELRQVALSERARSVAAVRSSAGGDEVVIVSFDLVASEEADGSAPVISSLKPDTVEQGRLKNLRLTVLGENFSEGASLLVNGAEIAADLTRRGKALEAKLPKSMFDQPAEISIQVKGTNGAVSQPRALLVKRADSPLIDAIKPDRVAGPASAFTLKVRGQNFRPSSVIVVGGQALNTERRGADELRAQVPEELVRAVGQVRVQVRDVALPDVVSNDKSLAVHGPVIDELRTAAEAVVAGAGSFALRVRGDNFRSGARVEVNGKQVPPARVIRLSGSSLKVRVPGNFNQDAGALTVIVRNPDGSPSNEKAIQAHAPEIKEFLPGQLLAGVSEARVDIRGANFRPRARVYVGGSNGQAFRIDKKRVRFRSGSRLVVTLGEEVAKLLEQKGSLTFQVVNPNEGDGVVSAGKEIGVLGPEISEAVIRPISGDDAHVRLTIHGSSFRQGAVVEFVSVADGGVRQRTPVKVKEDSVVIVVRAKRLSAWGQFAVRVVNPGNVTSNAKEPRQEEVAEVVE